MPATKTQVDAVVDGPVFGEAPGSIALQSITAVSEDGSAPDTSGDGGEPDQSNVTEYPSRLSFALIFISVSLFLVLGGLDINIISVAIPSITDHFHTIADVGWYYSAYRLSSSSLQFAFGKLYTMFPTKKLFILANFIFLCGSVVCASAVSSSMLVAGRAITGTGMAGAAAGFFKMMVDIAPLDKRPLLSSIFGVVEGLSSIAAPVIGGVIVQRLGWRWCFWINVPIGGVALLALIFFLPETSKDLPKLTWKNALRKLDITGTFAFVPALTALFIALNWGGITYSWSNPKVIALFVVFTFLIVIFAVDQVLKGDDATLPLRVLKDRNVMAGAVYSICIASSLSILEYYAPTYYQAVLGYSPARAGYMMLPCIVATTVAFLLTGIGTSKVGFVNPFMIVCAVLMPIGAGLMTAWSPTTNLAQQISSFALAGFGAGLGYMAPQVAIQTSLSKEDLPLGTAIILFSVNFGPALFVAIAQTIFTNTLSLNLDRLAPNSNVTYIEQLGLTEIKHEFAGEKLHDIIQGFSESVSDAWDLALGLSCVLIAAALATKWQSVKKKVE